MRYNAASDRAMRADRLQCVRHAKKKLKEKQARERLEKAAPDLLAACESAEMATTQIRMAADIRGRSNKNKVLWYEQQLDQLGRELAAAITKATKGD